MKKYTLLLLIIFLLLLQPVNINATSTDVKNDPSLGTDLRAYIDFSANSNDLTGNGYNGSDVNSPAYTGGVLNLVGSSNQYVLFPNGLIPWGTNALTINYWFKFDTAQTDKATCLMVARTGKGVNLYRGGTGGGDWVQSKPNVADISYVVGADTNWHMFTYVFRSSGTGMEMYIDGSSVNTGTNTANLVDPDGDTIPLGAYKSGGTIQAGWYPTGKAKHLGIWTKSLTTTDITNLYNSGTPLPYEATGVVSSPTITYPIIFE